jgi:phi13 family phage major tail protein
MASGKANRFNVKRIVYALVLENTASSYKYGPIKEFGVPMQVQFTPTVASGVLYGAGAKEEDISRLTGGELVIDMNKVFIEVRAEIYGDEYASGVMNEVIGTQPKDIAIGVELEETGDNRELCWFFMGKPRRSAQTTQQSTDNINFSTDSITIGLVQRALDKRLRSFGDTANSTFTSSAADAFLDTIPGGTLVTDTEGD